MVPALYDFVKANGLLDQIYHNISQKHMDHVALEKKMRMRGLMNVQMIIKKTFLNYYIVLIVLMTRSFHHHVGTGENKSIIRAWMTPKLQKRISKRRSVKSTFD